jgi:hypothetical protein
VAPDNIDFFCISEFNNMKIGNQFLGTSFDQHYIHFEMEFYAQMVGIWWTEYLLSRVQDQLFRIEMKEFRAGIRVSVGYNIVDQTLCVNPGVFIEPWEIHFQLEQQMIQCKTDIIGYPGNLKPTSLFGISETWLGECALSPYVTFTAWRMPLFETDQADSAHYMFN